MTAVEVHEVTVVAGKSRYIAIIKHPSKAFRPHKKPDWNEKLKHAHKVLTMLIKLGKQHENLGVLTTHFTWLTSTSNGKSGQS